MIAELWRPEVARSGNFVSNFCGLFWKKTISQTVTTALIAPKIWQGQPPPHLAHILPDFIQIGSLLAELLPNAWRPFLRRTVFPIYALRVYKNVACWMLRCGRRPSVACAKTALPFFTLSSIKLIDCRARVIWEPWVVYMCGHGAVRGISGMQMRVLAVPAVGELRYKRTRSL